MVLHWNAIEREIGVNVVEHLVVTTLDSCILFGHHPYGGGHSEE